MIRYALTCAQGHAFESWFANSAAYDKQVKRGLVGCPYCGNTEVEKQIMSPRLVGAKKRGDVLAPGLPMAARDAGAGMDTTAPSAGLSARTNPPA